MSEQENEFDDPVLRTAIRRAYAGETAPSALRARIEGVFAAGVAGTVQSAGSTGAASPGQSSSAVQTPSAATVKPKLSRWQIAFGDSPYKTLLAAGIAILCISLAIYQVWTTLSPSSSPPQQQAMTFPVAFAAEMVRTHESHAQLPDHHAIAGNDPTTMGAELTKLAGVAVWSTNLGDGWMFKGACVTTIGGKKAAHLLFQHDTEELSVFSMPAPATYGYPSTAPYRMTVEGLPIAGFVNNGALYCIVASRPGGTVAMATIDPLLAKVQACVGADACLTAPATTPAVH